MKLDVADRNPFYLDTIQATIWLRAPVAPGLMILLLIVTSPFIRLSSFIHLFDPVFLAPDHMVVHPAPVDYWTKV